MALVKDWIKEFTEVHMGRFPKPGGRPWPLPDSDDWRAFWRPWIAFSIAHSVSFAEANGVSQFMHQSAQPPRYLSDHEPMFERVTLELRAQQLDSVPLDIVAAKRLSAQCPDCDGMGLAHRYRHSFVASDESPIVYFFCVCAYGRFLSRYWKDRGPNIPYLDLMHYPTLWLGSVAWSDQPDNLHRYPLNLIADGTPIGAKRSTTSAEAPVGSIPTFRPKTIDDALREPAKPVLRVVNSEPPPENFAETPF